MADFPKSASLHSYSPWGTLTVTLAIHNPKKLIVETFLN